MMAFKLSIPSHIKSLAIKLLSLIAILAYIWIIELYYGWHKILLAWDNISFLNLALALLLMFSTYVIRALRLHNFALPVTHNKFMSCLKITLTHNFLNNLLPMRTGEISFPLLMRQELAVSITSSSAMLILFRLMDLQVLLMLGCLAFFMVHNKVLFIVPILPLFLMLPITLYLLKQWQKENMKKKYPRYAHHLFEMLSVLPQNRTSLIRAWLFTLACWVIKIMVYAYIMLWFADTSWWQVMSAAFSGELSSIIPIHTPGGLGTYEAGILAVSTLMGIKGDWVLFAAVQLHLLIIMSTLLSGALAYFIPQQIHPVEASV